MQLLSVKNEFFGGKKINLCKSISITFLCGTGEFFLRNIKRKVCMCVRYVHMWEMT